MTSPDILVVDRLAKVFTPNRPIDLPDLLSGRLNLLYRLQDDVLTPGKHVLLFGEVIYLTYRADYGMMGA